jgi:hypothetical protein
LLAEPEAGVGQNAHDQLVPFIASGVLELVDFVAAQDVRQSLRRLQLLRLDAGVLEKSAGQSAQEFGHDPGSLALHVRRDMGVDIEGDSNRGMAEHLGDDLRVDAAAEH